MRGEGKKLVQAARLQARGQLILHGADGSRRTEEEYVTEALAACGLYPEEPLEVDEEFALWPECLPVFNFWNAVQTQWRVGMNGATGLDYQGVEACMSMRAIPKKERPELFALVQAMERAALDERSTRK